MCDTPRPTSGSPYYPSYQPNNPLYPGSQVQNASGNPNQTYPGQYPGQAYPGQTYPGQRYPGQTYPYPGQANSDGTYPGQTNPSQRYPGQQVNVEYTTDINSRRPLYPESQGLSGDRGRASQSGQSGYQGYQTGYQGQTGYQEQGGYQSQTGTYGQSGNQGSSGQAGYYGQRPTSPGQPGSQNQFYPGYPGQQQLNPEGQRECSNQCINGVCIEGDTCRCNTGYVLDPSDVTGSR